MKEHLLELVRNIIAEGYNFNDQPIIFKWDWDDELPGIGFQLLIHGTAPLAEMDVPEDSDEEVTVISTENTTIH